ncbi:hypothetical protein ANN_11272 [Periplaneta americana]|uniref:Uncharacterized protein n=1 Tax=Periplaneta americana TaxID=6978 RepID=A0ABQ8T4K4_PERAM|nr:hypothetical protein ANN_11272 [Periplaneta americana]
MTGLCEGGNEPAGSLKAICMQVSYILQDFILRCFINCDGYLARPKPGDNMSLKMYFLHPHLVFLPENCGDFSYEHGERFQQEISSMEKDTKDSGVPIC